eukprot:gene11181-7758_t
MCYLKLLSIVDKAKFFSLYTTFTKCHIIQLLLLLLLLFTLVKTKNEYILNKQIKTKAFIIGAYSLSVTEKKKNKKETINKTKLKYIWYPFYILNYEQKDQEV